MTDRIDPYIMIPAAVYEAARLQMQRGMLEILSGGRRRLLEHPVSRHYATIASCEIPGLTTSQGRRLLEQCGRDPKIGFVELPRRSLNTMRQWELPPRLYEILRAEALLHWQRIGYRIGEIMPAIKEPV